VCCPSRLILARHIVTQLRQACSSCLRLFLHIPAGHAQRLTRPVQCMKLCSCHTALWHCRTRHLLHSRLLDMGKSGKSYYAVKMGRAPGQIFRTWPECESQVMPSLKPLKPAQFHLSISEYLSISCIGRLRASRGLSTRASNQKARHLPILDRGMQPPRALASARSLSRYQRGCHTPPGQKGKAQPSCLGSTHIAT